MIFGLIELWQPVTSDQPLEYEFGPVIDEPRVVSPVGYESHPFSGRREAQRGQPSLAIKTTLIPPKPEPVKVATCCPLSVLTTPMQVSRPKEFPISNPAAEEEASRGYTFGPVIEHERAVGAPEYRNDAHPFTGTESLQKNHPEKRNSRPASKRRGRRNERRRKEESPTPTPTPTPTPSGGAYVPAPTPTPTPSRLQKVNIPLSVATHS